MLGCRWCHLLGCKDRKQCRGLSPGFQADARCPQQRLGRLRPCPHSTMRLRPLCSCRSRNSCSTTSPGYPMVRPSGILYLSISKYSKAWWAM